MVPKPPHPLSGNLPRWLAIALVAVNLTLLAFAGMTLLNSRAKTIEHVRDMAMNLATLAEMNTSDMARRVDHALIDVIDTLQHAEHPHHAGEAGPDDWDRSRILAAQKARHPDIQLLVVMDARDRPRWSSAPIDTADLAQPDTLRALRDLPDARLSISAPIMSRHLKQWIVVFSRPYRHADGSFAGSVAAMVPVAHFNAMLAALDLGKHGSAVIRHVDHALLTRHPPAPGPGGQTGNAKISPEFAAFLASGQRKGVFHTPRAPDGIERTYASLHVRNMPYVLNIGMSPQDYLAAWHREAAITALLLGGFLLLSLAGAWLFRHGWRARLRDAEAVLASEARFRTYIESAPEGIFVADADGRYVEVNPAACALVGYSREGLLGMSIPDLTPPGHEGTHRDALREVLAHGTLDTEIELRRKAGDTVTVALRARVLPDGRIMGYCTDITGYRAAQNALARERALLRTLLDTLPDLVWLKDTEGVYLGCNRRFERFFGAREADIVGNTDYDFVDKALADAFRRHDRAAMDKDGPSVNEEEIAFADDGHRELLETTKTPMRDATGRLIGVLGIGHDISERNRGTELLLAEKQFSEDILNALPGVFYIFHSSGRFVRWNRRFSEIIGYDDASLATMQATAFFRGADQDNIADAMRQVFEEGQASVEAEFVTARGERLHYQFHGTRSVIQGEMYLLGLGIDIRARRQAEAELEQYRRHLEGLVEERTADLSRAKELAEAASRAKSTFLANMSHELRTPMSAILGMTEIAMRQATDPILRDQLGKVRQASTHLLHVINDILDISKIEASRLTLERVPFRIVEVVENLIDMIGERATGKGLKLHVRLEPGLPRRTLVGDPLRLGQILLNLAGNALKFTETGSITLSAGIVAEDAEALTLRWEVRDTGIGISIADQARLFNAFEQADGSMTRKYGGTGLGLAISKRLAQLMGGEIGVESMPGTGSTFWFTTRLDKSTAPEMTTPQATGSASAEGAIRERHAGRHVLLAEDEPINQEVSRTLLEEAGLIVDLAEDGAEAVDLARARPYDLILMDMQMPRTNGIDATRAIRAESLNTGTPILAMTANAFEEDRRACLEAGMNDHIAKPIHPDKLYSLLLPWLESSLD